ncbi:hypothetical protein [Eubacterium ventriosum]
MWYSRQTSVRLPGASWGKPLIGAEQATGLAGGVDLTTTIISITMMLKA